MDDDTSDLSSISSLSPAPSEAEEEIELKPQNGILKFFHKVPKGEETPANVEETRHKRAPSLPHEATFADNADIAFIVMFRKRFDAVMPKSLPHFGPHELEQDVLQELTGERVEHFLCALLALLLNRKQDIKAGQYSSALQEALRDFQLEWPSHWNKTNPLAGERKFSTLAPSERLDMLRQLIYWTLSHSEAIHTMITSAYNGKRTNDDMGQPLSVQPWGSDSDKRRYFLVEGDNDNSFRVYRESNPAGFTRTWYNVAGTIDEVKALADKLAIEDRGPNARKLSTNMTRNIANFEEKEEKRKRRDYRRQQRERFRRPEPGFSMYEGRTRGKRVKYTYSDEEFATEDSTRRSTRNTRQGSPVDTGPVITASGRQSKPVTRYLDEDGGVVVDQQATEGDVDMVDAQDDLSDAGRPRRSAARSIAQNGYGTKPRGRVITSSEEDDSEPELGDDEDEEDDDVPELDDEDEEDDDVGDSLDEDDEDLEDGGSPHSNSSRIVKLPLKVRFGNDGKAERLSGKDTEASTPVTTSPSQGATSKQTTATPPSARDETTNGTVLKPQGVNGNSVANLGALARASAPQQFTSAAQPVDISHGTEIKRPSVNLSTSPLVIRGSPEKPLPAGLPTVKPIGIGNNGQATNADMAADH